MTILLLCTMRALKVVAATGDDPSDAAMEAITSKAFDTAAKDATGIARHEFVSWACKEVADITSLIALLDRFGCNPTAQDDAAPPAAEQHAAPPAAEQAPEAAVDVAPDPADAAPEAAVADVAPEAVTAAPEAADVAPEAAAAVPEAVVAAEVAPEAAEAVMPDTTDVDPRTYADGAALEATFKQTMALQPRAISAGDGGWLCWIANEARDGAISAAEYPAKHLGDCALGDDVVLKLLDRSDKHVEYHTVKEFLFFCVRGTGADRAGAWTAASAGSYFDAGPIIDAAMLDSEVAAALAEAEARVRAAADVARQALAEARVLAEAQASEAQASAEATPESAGMFTYDDTAALEKVRFSLALQPRDIAPAHGGGGWLCWIADEGIHESISAGSYPSKRFGDCALGDGVVLKLMDLSDHRVEYHTVNEFLTFCAGGPGAPGAGKWRTNSPGAYFLGGGGLVDTAMLDAQAAEALAKAGARAAAEAKAAAAAEAAAAKAEAAAALMAATEATALAETTAAAEAAAVEAKATAESPAEAPAPADDAVRGAPAVGTAVEEAPAVDEAPAVEGAPAVEEAPAVAPAAAAEAPAAAPEPPAAAGDAVGAAVEEAPAAVSTAVESLV
ncbi:hypothetical protein M885DRAFT_592441 [Pelagophyceae sp. CCMP2097]|nr:hypothetical protein M885DRAFT_592441 [Pelagophyceae sp. CCMP2097]